MKADLSNWLVFTLQTLGQNYGWMSWNLFLALLPLAISMWLFRRPNSRWLRWGIVSLMVATFIPHAVMASRIALSLARHIPIHYLLWMLVPTLLLMAADLWLLKQPRSRSPFWWLGFLVFIVFLPNAPYVLTDIIHLIDQIRYTSYSPWVITLGLIPQYLLFMGIGFQAYVLSLLNLGDYLKRHGLSKLTPVLEWGIHGLSAIGIYLGRFQRFNSWDLVTQPDEVVTQMMENLASKTPVAVMFVTFVVIAVLYALFKLITTAIIQSRSPVRDLSRADSPSL
jgi:uncharacterized membrane protein